MTTNPLVTVLMPVYNGGDYLKPAIESILGQTYRDFEFLIINDCSTDDSMEIIQSYKDPRIVIHTNTVNMGQTKSLNVGLKLAKGKYIVINDADDLSLPHRIEKQLDFVSNHPEFAVVGTSAFIMNRSGRINRVFRKPTDQQEITLGILSETPLIHGSVIMNKAMILGHGGYNEEFRIIQDFELWSSLIRKGVRVANISDILVVIRHFADSVSFKEKDAQMLENAQTLLANITALTSLRITLEEALRQRIFFFAPDFLKEGDFKKAEELFVKEYRNFNDRVLIETDFVSRNLKQKMMKPYSKMALAELQKNRSREARKIAYHFLKEYGFSVIPFLIWTISYIGRKVLDKVIYFHEKWQKNSASLYHDYLYSHSSKNK